MPKWTEYTSKDTLADNDEVMLYDATARANKRGLMSKFWDYVVDKMSTAVIGKLETENKTIIGALNTLNSESSISLCKVISGENTFSSELKGKSYKAIIGFFYEPSDNPFSFGSGYFIAFQATYLQEANSFVIIGASLTGIIENKFVKLK
jgi:hypothetical protein